MSKNDFPVLCGPTMAAIDIGDGNVWIKEAALELRTNFPKELMEIKGRKGSEESSLIPPLHYCFE